jgi:hypothetical protein
VAAGAGPVFERGRRIAPKVGRSRAFDVRPGQADIAQHPLVEGLQNRHLAVMPPGLSPGRNRGLQPGCGAAADVAPRAERAGKGCGVKVRDRGSHGALPIGRRDISICRLWIHACAAACLNSGEPVSPDSDVVIRQACVSKAMFAWVSVLTRRAVVHERLSPRTWVTALRHANWEAMSAAIIGRCEVSSGLERSMSTEASKFGAVRSIINALKGDIGRARSLSLPRTPQGAGALGVTPTRFPGGAVCAGTPQWPAGLTPNNIPPGAPGGPSVPGIGSQGFTPPAAMTQLGTMNVPQVDPSILTGAAGGLGGLGKLAQGLLQHPQTQAPPGFNPPGGPLRIGGNQALMGLLANTPLMRIMHPQYQGF